ncbi:MBL fold metallo-hydrolase [Gulosibacter chungangensis]|uniref:MBL fold metallo-hydrolase n=1 Tax=Gulosibacter chungangensis TaxID=979746 RepID=A0A7J5BER0_9MICO|nr:MBL fold metallo-hydrolase [Gulosibacter chungangensis]KAB1644715.1 MBL fold metallo-hydrolase [Gulosibacter chungangensis]
MTHPFMPKLDAFGSVEIHYAELNDYENNCYVIVDTTTGAALIVDAADAAPYVLQLVETAAAAAAEAGRPEVKPVGILTTHMHPDHWQALADVRAALEVPTLAGEADAPEIPVATDRVLNHGDVVEVGSLTLDVIGLRGHTDGSVALAVVVEGEAPRLITGDSLFPGGIGNTWDDAERYERLLTDCVERIFRRYPNETVFYPGHGLPSTLGKERGFLNRWRLLGGLPAENPASDAYSPAE